MQDEATPNNKLIDWEQIAVMTGSLQDGSEHGDAVNALRALEILLGENALREAADHYISGAPGGELIRSILMLLRPKSVMEYCFHLYHNSEELQVRRNAIELLSGIADESTLKWVNELFDDPDLEIVTHSICLLDRLITLKFIRPKQAVPAIAKLAWHADPEVRECAAILSEGRGKNSLYFSESHLKKRTESLMVH